MDLRHLRYFVAVAEELSFTRAAERLHIAQPPLSQQIRQLEDELGVSLLYRTRRHVELTDSGRIYLELARQILRSVEAAAVQAQRAQRGEIGQLAVGFFEHTSYTVLPPILRAYRERYPMVDVQLRWFPVVDQVDALLRGDIDVSFLRPVFNSEDITSDSLLKEPFVLAVPSDHPFAELETVPFADCASESFIIYSQKSAPDFHGMIAGMCAAAGFVPKVAAEVAQVYTALGLVSSGAGIAFVPSAVRRVHFEQVVYKTLSGDDARIEVLLGWTQRTPSPLLKAFIDTAKTVVRGMSAPTPRAAG
ncbi:LysR family transcriptional regulator [Azospirillum sp. BE72]|uniref:LysR family transcriptional regulator n=1 Tax=Azospirillum sp. BE72 TaxID=2817776 RepID=UPI002861F482|nr:LysR family transcriptional regulator [Azospirillum sp. BE72]MDR6775389.1 DNA-binding transcriptional LysR family regulator [Azospirillum sp. BE72]